MGERVVIGEYYAADGTVKRVYEGDSFNITRESTNKAMKQITDSKGRIKIDYKKFVKVNTLELMLLIPTLSVKERALLLALLPYSRYETSHLSYGNGSDLKTDDIIALSGLKKTAAYPVISSLIEADILYKGENSQNNQYFLCPWIVMKGNMACKTLKDMFKNYRVLSHGGIPWGRMTAHNGVLPEEDDVTA